MGIQVLRANKPAKAAAEGSPGPPPAAATEQDGLAPPGRPALSRKSKTVYVLSNKPVLTRAYVIFGLRHGTMMIAIHDLLWSAIVVFLLVLATAHSREVSRIVEGDVQAHMLERAQRAQRAQHAKAVAEAAEHGGVHTALGGDLAGRDAENRSVYMRYVEFAYDQAKSMINHDNEAVKLNSGLHFATMLTMIMVFGISMAGIDMIASMMLLAGAMLHIRQLMMPWLSLRLIEMMLLMGFTVASMVGYSRGLVVCKVFVLMFFALCEFGIVFYHWLVAYSLHEHLCRVERQAGTHGGLVHHTRPAHSAVGAIGLGVCTCPRTRVGGHAAGQAGQQAGQQGPAQFGGHVAGKVVAGPWASAPWTAPSSDPSQAAGNSYTFLIHTRVPVPPYAADYNPNSPRRCPLSSLHASTAAADSAALSGALSASMPTLAGEGADEPQLMPEVVELPQDPQVPQAPQAPQATLAQALDREDQLPLPLV